MPATVVIPRIDPPPPGYWRVTQRHGRVVLQYAWTCPHCGVTTWVLADVRADERADEREERCSECGLRSTVHRG